MIKCANLSVALKIANKRDDKVYLFWEILLKWACFNHKTSLRLFRHTTTVLHQHFCSVIKEHDIFEAHLLPESSCFVLFCSIHMSEPEKNLPPEKEIAQPPFQGKNAKRRNDEHEHFRQMDHFHQSIGYRADIAIEPSSPNNLEKQVDEKGIHPHNGPELQPLPVMAHVNPPVAESQSQQTPAK